MGPLEYLQRPPSWLVLYLWRTRFRVYFNLLSGVVKDMGVMCGAASVGVLQDNLVLSAELIM